MDTLGILFLSVLGVYFVLVGLRHILWAISTTKIINTIVRQRRKYHLGRRIPYNSYKGRREWKTRDLND